MKYFKKSFMFLMILSILFPIVTKATEISNTLTDVGSTTIPEETEKNNSTSAIDFVSVSSSEVNLNTDFYLVLNLANIPYYKFKVEISNNANLPLNDLTSTVSELESTPTVTSFTVDKSMMNLNKLGIVYTSPAQETNIAFSVTVTDLEYTEEALKKDLETLKSDLSTLEEELKALDMNSETYETDFKTLEGKIQTKTEEINSLADEITNFKPNTLENSATIAIRKEVVKESDDKLENDLNTNADKNDNTQNLPWDDKDSLLENMDREKNKEMTASMKKMMEEMTMLEKDLQSANDTISSLTKNVTYQGSQNNYLSSLSIKNVAFKNNFRKTTLDYFATVDENTNSVTVNATAEDSSAIVTIYGNTNLKSGLNKVLITVTADDGSIKTYRIYITKP